MLKHTSTTRLDLGTSISSINESDLDDTRDELFFSLNNKEKNSGISQRSERSLTDILPKPTIQKIIERRQSELLTQDKLGSQILGKENIDDLNSSKEKCTSKESIHSAKEFIEEVQLDNSTYLIHKRKKADPNQKRNLSDTSTESGIASQISDVTQQQTEENNIKDLEETPEHKHKIVNNPAQPIAVSSPKPLNEQGQNHHQNKYHKKQQNKQRHSSSKSDIIDSHRSNASILKPYKQNQFHTIERSNSRPVSLHIDTQGSKTERRSYSRPTSARTDINHDRRYQKISNDIYSLGSNSTGLLIPYNRYGSSCTLPARSSKGTLKRKDTFRSISAGSSISNIFPQQARSVCSCHTSRTGLPEIREEMPVFGEVTVNKPEDVYKARVRKARYISIFFIIFAAVCCLVGGFLHFYVGHFPEEFRMNQGDVKLLPFSSTYCKGVRVSSDDGKSRLIAFQPNTDKTKRLSYTRTAENLKLHPKQIWERDFYILGGSEIDITIKTDSLVDIIVFRGENSYSIWKNRRESESYQVRETCCSDRFPRQGNVKFTAKTTDRYFIVLYSRVEIIPISIKIFRITFNRISYDFSATAFSCNADVGAECTVEYPFTGDNEVAVEVPLEAASNQISTSSVLKYMCVAREWFYCVFFIGIFLALTVSILIVYLLVVKFCIPSTQCCCYRNDQKNNKFDLVYYDNYGHATSDLHLNELPFDSVSHARSYAPSRKSELKSIYEGDSMSYVSKRSHANKQLHRPPSYDHMGNSNDIAAIYRDELDVAENADSGISINPELSPSGASSITAQEVQAIHEQRLLNLKRGRNRMRYNSDAQSLTLSNGPSVKSLLATDRPHSHGRMNQQYHQRFSSHPNLRYNHNNRNPDKYLQTMPHSGGRHSSYREDNLADRGHHEYNFEDERDFVENEDVYSEGEAPIKQIDYDDREIFI